MSFLADIYSSQFFPLEPYVCDLMINLWDEFSRLMQRQFCRNLEDMSNYGKRN